MKLYKEAGVNPLGGCLPLLLQFPILIAMYAVIRAPEARSPPTVVAQRSAEAVTYTSTTATCRSTASCSRTSMPTRT